MCALNPCRKTPLPPRTPAIPLAPHPQLPPCKPHRAHAPSYTKSSQNRNTFFRALSAGFYEKLGFSFDNRTSHTWRRKLIAMTSTASSTLEFFEDFQPVRFNFVLREVRGSARLHGVGLVQCNNLGPNRFSCRLKYSRSTVQFPSASAFSKTRTRPCSRELARAIRALEKGMRVAWLSSGGKPLPSWCGCAMCQQSN